MRERADAQTIFLSFEQYGKINFPRLPTTPTYGLVQGTFEQFLMT